MDILAIFGFVSAVKLAPASVLTDFPAEPKSFQILGANIINNFCDFNPSENKFPEKSLFNGLFNDGNTAIIGIANYQQSWHQIWQAGQFTTIWGFVGFKAYQLLSHHRLQKHPEMRHQDQHHNHC